MAEEREQIIIDVQTNTETTISKMAQLKQQIDALRDGLKELNKIKKENGELTEGEAQNYVDMSNSLKVLEDQYRKLGTVAQGEIKAMEEVQQQWGDSINGMRAKLSDMTAIYNNMSKAEREAAGGQELLSHIKSLSDELKSNEQAMGNYSRNVGNYKSALEGLLPLNKGFLGILTKVNAAGLNSAGGLKAAASGVAGLGKQFMALMANPIVAGIALIVAVIMKVVDAFKSSEERMNALQQAIAPLNPILDGISNAFTALAGVVADAIGAIIGGLSKFIEFATAGFDAVAGFFGFETELSDSYKQATKDAQDLEAEKQRLVKKEREMAVEESEIELEVSDLRAKAAEKNKYTAQERLNFLKQAVEKEKKLAADKKKLAEENLAMLEKEAARTENSAEMNEKLAQARIAVNKATSDYNKTLRRLNSNITEAENEIAKEEEERQKKRREAWKKAAEERKNAIKEVQSYYVELTKDTEAEELALEEANYQRVLAIAKKYKQDTTLVEEQHQKNMADIREKYEKQATEQQKKALADFYKDSVTIVEEGLDRQNEVRNTKLELQQQKELNDLKQKYVDGLLTEEEYQSQMDDLQAEHQQQSINAEMTANNAIIEQNELLKQQIIANNLEIQNSDTATAEAKLEAERKANEEIQRLDDETTQAQIKNSQLLGKQQDIDIKQAKKAADEKKKLETAKQKATESTLNVTKNVLSSATQLVGEETAAGKAMAVAGATIDTFQSANSAYKSMAGIPYVGPALGVAAAAAAIASGIANVKSILAVNDKGSNSTPSASTATTPAPNLSSLASITDSTQAVETLVGDEQIKAQQDTRVYVLESDITSTQNKVSVLESQNSF